MKLTRYWIAKRCIMILCVICIAPVSHAELIEAKLIQQNAIIIKRLYDAYKTQRDQFHLQNQAFHLQSGQYNVLKQQFANLKSHLDLVKQNLKGYKHLARVTPDPSSILDNPMPMSNLTQWYELSPDNRRYDQASKQYRARYLVQPNSSEQLAKRFASLLPASQVQQLQRESIRQLGNHHQLLDLVRRNQQQGQQAGRRIQQLRQMRQDITMLGDHSELETEQLKAGELLLIAEQQEALAQNLRNMQMLQTTNRMERVNASVAQDKAEFARVHKTLTASKPAPHLTRWGNL